MVSRRPLVLASGLLSELPPGDTVVGADVTVGTLTAGSGLSGGGNLSSNQRVDVSLVANPSGIIFVGNQLGLDGAAQRTADTALSSGNAALSLGSTALASGNAGLSLASTALASGNAALARTLIQTAVNLSGGVTGAVPYQSGVGTTAFLSPGVSGQVLSTRGASLSPQWITPGGGKVLQVVQGTRTSAFTTTSTSFVSTGLSATITPSSSSSRILILCSSALGTNGSATTFATIYRDSTDLAPTTDGFALQYNGNAGFLSTSAAISYVDSPATTSAITYAIYLRTTSGSNTAFFGSAFGTGFTGAITSTLILAEIAA